MPKDMFQLLVCPPVESTRRWYTVPVSALLHIAFLAVVIVVPLVATDARPAPKAMLAFITPSRAKSVPPPDSYSALQIELNTRALKCPRYDRAGTKVPAVQPERVLQCPRDGARPEVLLAAAVGQNVPLSEPIDKHSYLRNPCDFKQ